MNGRLCRKSTKSTALLGLVDTAGRQSRSHRQQSRPYRRQSTLLPICRRFRQQSTLSKRMQTVAERISNYRTWIWSFIHPAPLTLTQPSPRAVQVYSGPIASVKLASVCNTDPLAHMPDAFRVGAITEFQITVSQEKSKYRVTSTMRLYDASYEKATTKN